MKDCAKTRPLLPWYVKKSLAAEESRSVAAHLASCAACREELVSILRIGMELEDAVASGPSLSEEVWRKVRDRTQGEPLAKLDVGSFVLGFSLGARLRQGRIPVQGNLRVLGRKVRLFNLGRREDTHES